MFHALRRSRLPFGIRAFVLTGSKVPQAAAPQDERLSGTSGEDGDGTGFMQDDGALDRLLSRTELELLDPDAVRRREIMARLKLAAASVKAKATPEAPGSA